MRRFLVLALTMALGLTALAAIPATARSHGGESSDDCKYVWTSDGRECLTDQEIQDLRKDGRETKRHHKDDDSSDHKYRRHHKDDDSSDHKYRRHHNRGDSYRDYRWLRYLDDWSSDSCDCLSRWERRQVSRLAEDPDRKDVRRVLWYLYQKDCLTDREFRRHRRDARNLDEADLRRIIKQAADCGCTNSDDRYWFDDWSVRRLDKRTGLNQRSIRQILGIRNGHDCVSRGDMRRLGRRADDLDFWDIYGLWGGSGRR